MEAGRGWRTVGVDPLEGVAMSDAAHLSHRGTGHAAASATPVAEVVARALQEGILTPEQADRLLELAPSAAPPPAPVPAPRGAATEPAWRAERATRLRAVVAEALGYVGAVLVIVAGIVTAQQFWDDLAPVAHALLAGLLAVVLLAAGQSVHGAAGTPFGRLGSVLWALAVAAVAGTAAIVGGEILEYEEETLALAILVPATVVALVTWWQRPRGLQQAVALVGIAGTSAAALAQLDVALGDWGGLMVWAIGIAWMLLSWSELLRPPDVGLVLGAVAALMGPMMTAGGRNDRLGLVLGVATALGLVAASVTLRVTAVLAVGVVGLFLFVPQLVFEFFGDQLGAPVALLVSGALLLGTSLWIARTRHDEHATR